MKVTDFGFCLLLSSRTINQSTDDKSSSTLASIDEGDDQFNTWDFAEIISESSSSSSSTTTTTSPSSSSWDKEGVKVVARGYKNVTLESNSKLCVLIDHPLNQIETFIPIRRVSNMESSGERTGGEISSKEKNIFIFMSCLYFFVVSFILFFEFQSRFNYKNIRFINILVFSSATLRGIFFALSAANIVGNAQTDLADFFLMELPIFCFFSAMVVAALLWYQVTHRDKANDWFREILLVLTGIPLVLLIIVLVCYIEFQGEFSDDSVVLMMDDRDDDGVVLMMDDRDGGGSG
eukprot:TRINITY_DN818_c0_g5_i1.p1 TRINITY_DN818_c0_g5~~TRINITY_DN818_c0_g5_i1.p1  ORF type:complete len:302 (-),score=85.25 TRINITY_DN818_c0_g5_i1:634-1509(-)